jgi:hypothetical protein
MLSKHQKAILCQMAADAYAVQKKHGLIDDDVKLEAWRREEQRAAVGIESLKDCRQAHYLPLRGHFAALAGKTEVATFQDTQAAPDDPYRLSMAEALRTELQRFAELTDEHGKPNGPHRAEGYLFAIAQHRGRLIPRTVATIVETWNPKKVEELVYTMRNRINAMRDVGKAENRNKSQRKGGGSRVTSHESGVMGREPWSDRVQKVNRGLEEEN